MATPTDAVEEARSVELERGVVSCTSERKLKCGVLVALNEVARIPREVFMGNGELPTEFTPMSDCLVRGDMLTSRLSKMACWDCVKLEVLTSISPSVLRLL